MKYKTLGNTGLLVSQMCLGTMTFSDGSGIYKHIGNVDQSGADELVKASIERGINFFDTADVYSAGASETTLGQSFRNLGVPRSDVVLATKVSSRMGQGRNDVGASRGHIMDAVEASLARLQTDHIDLYQVHATDLLTPIEETMRALDDLVRQGKVRYIGVSNWSAWRIAIARGVSARLGLAAIDTLQAYYSIAGRDLERELVPLVENERMGLLIWSPLAGGLLSGKYSRDDQSPEGSRRTGFDFPIVDKERGMGRDRCPAPDRRGAWLQPGARRPGLASFQAGRDLGAGGRQAAQPARGQPRGGGPRSRRRGSPQAGCRQRAAARVSGLDACYSGCRPPRSGSTCGARRPRPLHDPSTPSTTVFDDLSADEDCILSAGLAGDVRPRPEMKERCSKSTTHRF